MTSSSDRPLQRGLDAMIIVYSLLQDHPASAPCDSFIRDRTGWFTTTLTLLEVKTILTKVYQVAPAAVTRQLAPFTEGYIDVFALDAETAYAAMASADELGLDLTDAVLLRIARNQSASFLVTDDRKLIQACIQTGISTENPIDEALRRQILEWETIHLAPKGLPRILRRIHDWLNQMNPSLAEEFWSLTGGSSHLP